MSAPFQATVGVTAVQLTDEAELAGAVMRYGVLVVTPVGNTGLLYFGFSDAVTTSNGCHIPNGVPFTIAPAWFPINSAGRPDLTTLHFISDTASQKVTGGVL